MSTVTVSRANVTAEEVAAVLRQELGDRYDVTPSMSARFHSTSASASGTVLVKRNWLQQANVRIVAVPGATEFHITSSSSVTLGGILINRASIVRTVHHALEHAAEFATAGPSS
jgi:hypothetical protein